MEIEYILIFLIIFIGALIQGMTSFGSSLFALPLLLYFLDVKEIVPLLATYNLFMNTLIFRKIGKDANLKSISPLLITAIIFTLVGAFALKGLDTKYIKITIGIMMLITSTTSLFGLKVLFKKPEKLFIPVGMVSGLLNGSTGMSGPPVLLFLSNQNVEKNVFRSTLTSYFLVLNVISITTYAFTKIYNNDVLKLVVLYLPALISGTLIGIKLGNKINEKLFKKIVLGFVFVMGILLLLKA
ncbi:sulfite exporter TauE/SafE family protein [Mycoplasmatota bacterium WC44]